MSDDIRSDDADIPEQPSPWFLVQFKPNCEKIAERNLLRLGFEIFLPRQEETRRAGARITTRLRPLFPGYLFVAVDLAEARWRAINSTYGVSRIVSLGAGPTPVPQKVVAQIRARCDDFDNLRSPPELAPGDQISITRGPFADFIGTIEKVDPVRRIWMLLELLGQKPEWRWIRTGTRWCGKSRHAA